MSDIKGKVHSFESFALVDGPGVRYCVFLQGCHMRCKFCHNPETWDCGCGEEWTAQDLFNKVIRYKNYWGKKEGSGGMTVSGGEPLLQMEFVTEYFRLAKTKKVHTCMDTAGGPFPLSQDQVKLLETVEIGDKEALKAALEADESISDRQIQWMENFDSLCQVTDLFMLDLKAMDPQCHKDLTGLSNDQVLAMARYLSDHGKSMWIRHVLVPDLTDDPEDLRKMREFIDSLKTVEKTEILPYHTLGVFKWENLGLDYPLKDARIPDEEEVKKAEEILGIVK